MRRKLLLSAAAEVELFEAALRYEREVAGLGFRFESEIGNAFERVLESPFQFPEIDRGARRALVPHFPYGVFFVVEDELVTVLAVLHLHRHPDTWKSRRPSAR
jgi:hypothetical protein